MASEQGHTTLPARPTPGTTARPGTKHAGHIDARRGRYALPATASCRAPPHRQPRLLGLLPIAVQAHHIAAARRPDAGAPPARPAAVPHLLHLFIAAARGVLIAAAAGAAAAAAAAAKRGPAGSPGGAVAGCRCALAGGAAPPPLAPLLLRRKGCQRGAAACQAGQLPLLLCRWPVGDDQGDGADSLAQALRWAGCGRAGTGMWAQRGGAGAERALATAGGPGGRCDARHGAQAAGARRALPFSWPPCLVIREDAAHRLLPRHLTPAHPGQRDALMPQQRGQEQALDGRGTGRRAQRRGRGCRQVSMRSAETQTPASGVEGGGSWDRAHAPCCSNTSQPADRPPMAAGAAPGLLS